MSYTVLYEYVVTPDAQDDHNMKLNYNYCMYIYSLATYWEKSRAWFKQLLVFCRKCCHCAVTYCNMTYCICFLSSRFQYQETFQQQNLSLTFLAFGLFCEKDKKIMQIQQRKKRCSKNEVNRRLNTERKTKLWRREKEIKKKVLKFSMRRSTVEESSKGKDREKVGQGIQYICFH